MDKDLDIMTCCPVCDAAEALRQNIDNSYLQIGAQLFTYSLDHCGNCGAVYSAERSCDSACYTPELDLEDMYGNQSRGLAPLSGNVWNLRNKSRQIKELINIVKDKDEVRYLEIGASDGTLFRMFDQKASGKEISASLVEPTGACLPLESLEGVTIHSDRVEDADLTGEFDLIVSSHSFEHMTDPRGVLRILHHRLAADGKLYIEVPDGERWDRSLAVPLGYFHIVNYTVLTLTWLLDDMGFTVEGVRTIDNYPGIRIIAGKGEKAESLPPQPYMAACGLSAIHNWQDARDAAKTRLLDKLEALHAKNILIRCGGAHTVSVLKILEAHAPQLTFDICDRSLENTKLGPHAILSMDAVTIADYDAVLVSSYAFQGEIEQELLGQGLSIDKIITLYDDIFSYVA